MKQLLYIPLFIFCANTLRAQDTIIKRNDVRIIGKVTEIGPAEVKYRRMDMPDGPLFIERKEEIRMIIYKGGQKEIFDAPVTSIRVGDEPPVAAVMEDPGTNGSCDSIFTKDNSYVRGYVVRLTNEEVRFSRPGFKNGPVYFLPMAGVQAIHFADGRKAFEAGKDNPAEVAGLVKAPAEKKLKELLITKEGNHYLYNKNTLNEKELHALLNGSKNPEILQLVNKAERAKKKAIVFMICTIAGPTLLIAWPLFVVAEPGFVIAWLSFRKYRLDKNMQAIALYNTI
jgi:hypothetical protein